jgi:hypothetical protein
MPGQQRVHFERRERGRIVRRWTTLCHLVVCVAPGALRGARRSMPCSARITSCGCRRYRYPDTCRARHAVARRAGRFHANTGRVARRATPRLTRPRGRPHG